LEDESGTGLEPESNKALPANGCDRLGRKPGWLGYDTEGNLSGDRGSDSLNGQAPGAGLRRR